ncbi:MAG TPA: carboxypeptidase regulatory-like domain-containing protein [Candidatus Sulfotelmatobacter sp.]|nr:carboxypeptidase regulatory-like domain-containing protein [Candidatus Sulfotelmatobacter sp.]
MVRKLSCLLPLVLTLGGLSSVLHAQSAQITGAVRDNSGAVVVKASVRVINQSTLVERRATTNDAGIYAVPYLGPGSYQVAVEVAGFQTAVSNVTLTVDQVLVLNVQLKVGEANIKVEVKAPPETIDLNDAQISGVVDSRQISALPLITRNPYDLMALVPGVNPSDNTGSGGFSVNGGRNSANNFRLDGADSNDVEGSTGSIVAVNPESTQEFRVLTNNFMPEYGRNNGAVIDVITKSGTNQFHGGAYEFGRWNWLGGARDYFNPGPDPMAPYIRHIFGASFSGPILKDKTFFFFNYEAQRFVNSTINSAVVPTQGFRAGNFIFNGHDQNGNPFSVPIDVSTPTSKQNVFQLPLDPTVQAIFSHYPVAPDSQSPDGIAGRVFFPVSDRSSTNNFTLKVDHNFSSKENLSLRYVVNPFKDNGVVDEFIPGVGAFPDSSTTQLGAAHLVSTFTANWLNDFTFGLNDVNASFNCGSAGIINSVRPTDRFGHGTDFGFSDGIPAWGCPAQTDGFSQLSGTLSFSDHMVRIFGRHTTTFGFEFAALHSNTTFGLFSRPQILFTNFSDIGASATATNSPADIDRTLQDSIWSLFGQVATQQQAQFFNPAGTRLPKDLIHMRENDYALFWQDSFKFNKNLTLNYGLRWELNGAPYETDNLLSTASLAELSGPPPVVFHVARHGGESLYAAHHFDLQPRISFAWDPAGDGKTSVRGGYGVFEDHLFLEAANTVRGNPPFAEQQQQLVFPVNGPGSPSAITGLPVPADFPSSPIVPQGSGFFAVSVDPKLRLPYSQNWNFGIQRDLGHNVQLEMNYVGVQGKRLISSIDGNAPDPAKVAALRKFCQNPTNAFGCQDGPNLSDAQETVQSFFLYFGQEFGVLPFDAVNNNAIFHAQVIQTAGNSTYNALQANVTKRYAHGLYLHGAYTWSHEIDDAAGDFGPSVNNALIPANSHDLKQERGNGAQDVRQALVLDFTEELPFGRGRAFLTHGVVGKVLEGWTVSGIARFQGGFPFDIFMFRDSQGTGLGGTERPDFNPNGALVPVLDPRLQTGPNVGLFSPAPFGSVGTLHRNVFRVPYTNNWDMALTKNTHVTERIALEFRAEAYNLFNRVQFTAPANFIDFGELFGQSFSETQRPDGTTGARQMQLALKLNF